jgi:hypothetical protein
VLFTILQYIFITLIKWNINLFYLISTKYNSHLTRLFSSVSKRHINIYQPNHLQILIKTNVQSIVSIAHNWQLLHLSLNYCIIFWKNFTLITPRKCKWLFHITFWWFTFLIYSLWKLTALNQLLTFLHSFQDFPMTLTSSMHQIHLAVFCLATMSVPPSSQTMTHRHKGQKWVIMQNPDIQVTSQCLGSQCLIKMRISCAIQWYKM